MEIAVTGVDGAAGGIVDVANNPRTIIGYCSLSATRLDLGRTGSIKGLPHSIEVGALLLGKLAIDRNHQRRGIGTRLLVHVFDDIALTVREMLGLFAVVVDAIDAKAAGYYADFGFTPFADDPHRLYYPLKDYEESRAAAKGIGLP